MRSQIDLAVMAAIPLLTLLDLLWRPWWAVWGVAAASCAFVGLQARHVAPGVRRTSLVLALVTGALLPMLPTPWLAVEQGLRIGGLVASLLATVGLLSRAVTRVPRARDVLASLYGLPPRGRYFGLSVASQFFGGLLGLAGIALMMEAAARQESFDEGDKLSSFSAIARGYAALSLWSPMYSNMSIVLALHPGTHWAAVLPVAVLINVLFVGLGTALDRLNGHRVSRAGLGANVAAPQLIRRAWPVVLAMLLFLGTMVLASRGLALPISAVIIAGAPMGAWGLNAWMNGRPRLALGAGAAQLATDLSGFRVMAGEVLMFVASGCAGTVIAGAIPAAWTAAVGQWVAGSPVLACLALSTGIVLLSAAAIHPMLSAVIVGSSLTPALLNLPVLLHLSAVLVGWGLAIIVTPFSVLSLMASRWSGIHVLAISLRANALFVLLALASSALALGLLAHMVVR